MLYFLQQSQTVKWDVSGRRRGELYGFQVHFVSDFVLGEAGSFPCGFVHPAQKGFLLSLR